MNIEIKLFDLAVEPPPEKHAEYIVVTRDGKCTYAHYIRLPINSGNWVFCQSADNILDVTHWGAFPGKEG